MLNHKKRSVITVEHNDMDKFISEVYDRTFEFVADEEANNYSSYEFTVERKTLDDYDTKKLDGFKATGKGQFLSLLLLTDLCNKGLIESGDYIIQVSW